MKDLFFSQISSVLFGFNVIKLRIMQSALWMILLKFVTNLTKYSASKIIQNGHSVILVLLQEPAISMPVDTFTFFAL